MNLQLYLKPESFYDVYMWNIMPRIQRIDLLLKLSSSTIKFSEAAQVLDISQEELRTIMERKNIKRIGRKNFLKIMICGSSEICQFLSREIRAGSPLTYTKEDVAYIYNLNSEDVGKAFEHLGIKEATALTLPGIFLYIPPTL